MYMYVCIHTFEGLPQSCYGFTPSSALLYRHFKLKNEGVWLYLECPQVIPSSELWDHSGAQEIREDVRDVSRVQSKCPTYSILTQVPSIKCSSFQVTFS